MDWLIFGGLLMMFQCNLRVFTVFSNSFEGFPRVTYENQSLLIKITAIA